jgi:hypothetical protein
MAEADRGHGDNSVISVDRKLIPPEILSDSILVHLAAAYFSVGKQLEQKSQLANPRIHSLHVARRSGSQPESDCNDAGF